MTEPKVSIVIPVYNGSNYMREAIDSALGQTYKNCEVIVVNDGSTDGGATEKVAQSYGDKIRYFTKENGGVATAINYGIKRMTGEYFAWLSHDDVFYPTKIEKQIRAIQASGDLKAICHSNFDFLYMDTGECFPVDWEAQYTREQLEDSCFAPVFLCIHGSTVLIHRSHFERVGLYDPMLRATQDSEFLFRAMRGQRSVFVSDRLIAGRIHPDQGQRTMSCHVQEYNQMFVDFCEKLKNEEKIHMCGSVVNFYYRLYLLLKHSKPATTILDYLRERLSGEVRAAAGENFWGAFDELRRRGIEKVFIFGAGQYGKETLEILRSYQIPVEGFVDNDIKKQGTIIENIMCFSPAEVLGLDRALFVVAMMHNADVLKQLEEVRHVVTCGRLKKDLFKVIPAKFEI